MNPAYVDPAVLARVARIIVNARGAAATNDRSSDREPSRARDLTCEDSKPGPEVGRAA